MPESKEKLEQRRMIGLIIQQAIAHGAKLYWPGKDVEATIIEAGYVQIAVREKNAQQPVKFYGVKITATWS